MRIASPPTRASCFYGVDTPEKSKLLASRMSIEEMAEFIRVDSLGFLSHRRALSRRRRAGPQRGAAAVLRRLLHRPVPDPAARPRRRRQRAHACRCWRRAGCKLIPCSVIRRLASLERSKPRRTHDNIIIRTAVAITGTHDHHTSTSPAASPSSPALRAASATTPPSSLPLPAPMSLPWPARSAASKNSTTRSRRRAAVPRWCRSISPTWPASTGSAASIHERWGKLDILVANAGVLGVISPIGHVEAKVFEKVMTINVTATWRLIRSVDPLLRLSDAGRAVIVSSGAAHSARAFWAPYAASKAAVEALARSWADETRNLQAARQHLRSRRHPHRHARPGRARRESRDGHRIPPRRRATSCRWSIPPSPTPGRSTRSGSSAGRPTRCRPNAVHALPRQLLTGSTQRRRNCRVDAR